jgi:predicted Zn-dependent peptidase
MKAPKLIDKWFDKHHNIRNYLYRYENGVRLVVSQNPATVEMNLTAVFQAGSYFERQVGVPQGTAHFLEHMMCNPSDLFKTREEMDVYTFGNRNQPTIYKNAATSRKYLYFYLNANYLAHDRSISYLNHQLHYPMTRFPEFMETERKIILAEWHHLPKPDKDASLQAKLFLLDGHNPEFSEAVIGTAESISQIQISDLEKYYKEMLNADNLVIAVQMPHAPNRTILTRLNSLATGFAPALPKIKNQETLYNSFRYRVFNDPKQQGLYMSFNYFIQRRPEYDYKEQVLYYLLNNLINKVGKDEYREKRGLVYDVGYTSMDLTWDWLVRGYKLTCDPKNTLEMLDLSLTFWEKGIEFLKTSHGKLWFTGQISKYIFPLTTQFDNNYAEDIAAGVLEQKYKYIHVKAVKAARTMKLHDLIGFIEVNFKNTPPHIWIETSLPEEEVAELINVSEPLEYWTKKRPA